MTASQRRTVTVLVAALGVAFLMVWAATAGPEQVIVGQQLESVVVDGTQSGVGPGQEPDTDSSDDQPADVASSQSVGSWLRDVATFVLLVALLVVAGLSIRGLFVRIRRGLADERLVVPLDPLPDLDVARAAIERDHDRQREALAQSDVRNGIVACWVIFEEAAAEAHVPKQPAETASAFVVRFLHSLDVDPGAVGALAGLYLEARFSTHAMPADARARAERALDAIHWDLDLAGAAL